MRRVLALLALVAVSTLLALAAGELVVRSLFKERTVMFPRYHTDYRYGVYTLRGIRPQARFRHTSVDGSWEFVTNSKGLREGRGVRAEVLNAGVSGFSTAEALAFLENEGVRYQPDVVVLGFYGNDFEDNLKADLFALEQDKLVARKYEHIPGVRLQNLIYSLPGVQWLSENSYFYSLLFNHVWMFAKASLRDQAVKQARSGDAVDVGDFEYALASKTEHSPYEVALTLALIERMQRFCRERGARLLIVDIPHPAGPYRMVESMPAPAMKRLGEAQVELVSSRVLLGDFDGAAEMHLPAGHRHISEFTHTAIGVELGRRIAAQAVREPIRKGHIDGK